MADESKPTVDPSMLTDENAWILRDWLFDFTIRGDEVRMPLNTSAEAIAYAERVISATQRFPENDAIPPFLVEDRGNTWLVRASGTKSPFFNPIQVELRKSDATVVEYGATLRQQVAPEPR